MSLILDECDWDIDRIPDFSLSLYQPPHPSHPDRAEQSLELAVNDAALEDAPLTLWLFYPNLLPLLAILQQPTTDCFSSFIHHTDRIFFSPSSLSGTHFVLFINEMADFLLV